MQFGGPTMELFANSYNNSKETTQEIKITSCAKLGYEIENITSIPIGRYNNNIYNNGTICTIAAPGFPGYDDEETTISVFGNLNYLNYDVTRFERGLRPVVIIPKSNFTYQIIEESE